MSGEPSAAPEPVRWSSRAAFLFAAGALFAGAGVALRDVALLLLAVPVLLAPVAAYLAAPPAEARGRLRWEAQGGGREVVVEGHVAFEGLTPAGVSLALEPPPPLREVEAPRTERSASELTVRAVYEAERPCLAIYPRPPARWRDPLGLVERAVPLEGSALRIERFPPEVARLRATYLRRTTPFPGEARSRHRGGAGEFFSLRESQTGDTPKQINWAASARARRWLANEYLLEKTGDLLIILDLRPTPLGPRRDAEMVSMGRAAALGIASAFLAEKARVGLATFEEYVQVLPLGTGRLQRYRVRQLLQNARVGETAGPPERLAVSLSRYFPRGIGTLVISTLTEDDSPLLLAHLRRRGFQPFVLAPSPLPLIAAAQPADDPAAELVTRMLRLARRQRLAQVWQEAPVVEWEDYWSLTPLVRFLSRPPAGARGAG